MIGAGAGQVKRCPPRRAIARDDVAMNRAMGTHGAALVTDGARVLTHCNAGALATAGHGTALGVVRSAVEAGKHIFAEKPVAVDATGIRSIIVTSELAAAKNLSVVGGFVFRRDRAHRKGSQENVTLGNARERFEELAASFRAMLEEMNEATDGSVRASGFGTDSMTNTDESPAASAVAKRCV